MTDILFIFITIILPYRFFLHRLCFQSFWQLLYRVSQCCSWHLRFMFHHIGEDIFLMRLARNLEQSAVSFLDHIVLIHEQTISNLEDISQKLSSPCRDDQ